MNLSQAIELIGPAFADSKMKRTWADLGCGTGLFTSALAELLPEGSLIYAVDSAKNSLEKINPHPKQKIKKILADFTNDNLTISDLDGILMANSIHFVRDKIAFIKKVTEWIKHEGDLLLVEYDMESPSRWVPYPLSFNAAKNLCVHLDFNLEKIGERPSVYHHGGMYAALLKRK